MILKNLINKSVYGTTGYINSVNDLEKIEQYIIYNLPVLKEFKQILVATNYNNLDDKNSNKFLWKRYFPDCVLIDLDVNRGRNFGTTDLDNALFDYCKSNKIQWLCKSDNDVILNSQILDKEIEEADFYYINSIGYGGLVKYNFDYGKAINDDFYPQTWLYFIDTYKTDYINDKEYIDQTYEQIKSIPNYNNKIWEYIDGWSCETFLRKCIERNNLTKYHLVPLEKYSILLQLVEKYQIHDCSYKNIMIDGMCHLQFPKQQIISI
jgi:hypothetical protein